MHYVYVYGTFDPTNVLSLLPHFHHELSINSGMSFPALFHFSQDLHPLVLLIKLLSATEYHGYPIFNVGQTCQCRALRTKLIFCSQVVHCCPGHSWKLCTFSIAPLIAIAFRYHEHAGPLCSRPQPHQPRHGSRPRPRPRGRQWAPLLKCHHLQWF